MIDNDRDALRARLQELDDETLLGVTLTLLGGTSATRDRLACARLPFLEAARQWIPAAALDAGLRRLDAAGAELN